MNRVKSHRSSCAPFDARLALIAILLAAAFAAPLSTAAVTPTTQPRPGSTVTAVTVPPASSGQPNFGANVYIFAPSTPQGTIQATVDAVASTQVSNQFGTQRYAFLFEPGTYGSSANPLIFQVGYYTTVAGLGLSPSDVTINGAVNVSNQCDSSGSCTALVNFWRSLSNLTINVVTAAACTSSAEFWAVSQASPMRRVQINGNLFLFDYCSNPAFASGGFIADSQFTGGAIINGGQQQWITRNSNVDTWTNGVWNQVFSGVVGAPAQCFPEVAPCSGPYTTLATSPVTREEPYLYLDSNGNYNVFVPAVQRNTSGASWAAAATPGSSIPINRFYVAQPTDSVEKINLELLLGKNLILTPGIYDLDRAIIVPYPDTVVLGLGMPTLIPQNGNASMSVLSSRGVMVSGIIFDAGPKNSPVLFEVGSFLSLLGGDGASFDPSAIHDVFFRIGGAAAGKATFSLVVNSNNVILDDIWGWRADHGNGVGWTVNTADTGLVVNGDNVTAYGLFIEHYQKFEIIWNGNGGTDIFLQNEMPYDPPSQAAWMEAPGVNGYAAFKVANHVTRFNGYGLGSYSFFNQGINIFAANAFEVPSTLPAGSMNDMLTIFLNTSGSGGILNVLDNTGGSSTIANPDTPVTVVSYP
jgi:hypothetical protein